MHIVIATASCQPDKHDAMVDVLTTLSTASRDDDGCQSYEFYTSIEDPNQFRSVEMWASADAAGAHMGQPHVATALQDLEPLLASAPSIISYGVSDETTIA